MKLIGLTNIVFVFSVGCAQVPDDNYVVEYPDMTYQTDLALTPVYTDSTKVLTIGAHQEIIHVIPTLLAPTSAHYPLTLIFVLELINCS